MQTKKLFSLLTKKGGGWILLLMKICITQSLAIIGCLSTFPVLHANGAQFLPLNTDLLMYGKQYDDIPTETPCIGPCVPTVTIHKTKSNSWSSLCLFGAGSPFPVQWLDQEKGTCTKFQCLNGFYYTFSGWTFDTCVLNRVNPAMPICPVGTCK